jgi:hypothetical protein
MTLLDYKPVLNYRTAGYTIPLQLKDIEKKIIGNWVDVREISTNFYKKGQPMVYFAVEGSRTSCTVNVVEFLLEFLYDKIMALLKILLAQIFRGANNRFFPVFFRTVIITNKAVKHAGKKGCQKSSVPLRFLENPVCSYGNKPGF